MIAIAIENLVKKFGSHTALDGISLRIEAGEIFFLLGPSGCGKTTLLRCIAGFATPEEGRIFFGDEDVTRLPPHKRNSAMMFQSYALWPHMTVAKNVAFGLEQRRLPATEIRRRVAEALQSVRMEEHASRAIAQLSGGQQQRVALARALVVRPKAVLLDEPLSNLDARLRLEMREEIRRICKDFNLTAVYVTHDQKEALSVSDRMAVLVDGKIAQVGTPAEVYRKPRSAIVANFIGETNFLSGTVSAGAGADVAIATDLGIFHGRPADSDWTPRAGEPCLLSIRPESLVLSKEAHGANSIRGRIGRATYLGEVAQYYFLAGSHTLRIFEMNPHLSQRAEGQELFAAAAPEDVVVLKT